MFRPYRPEEESTVIALMRALDAEGAGIRPIREEMPARTFAYLRGSEDRGACVVAVDEAEQIVGYALLFPFWSAEYGGLLLLLDELYVAPARRSQGLGAAFLAWIEAYAAARGHVAISLVAMAHNERAIAFYDRAGYHRIAGVSFDKLLGPHGR